MRSTRRKFLTAGIASLALAVAAQQETNAILFSGSSAGGGGGGGSTLLKTVQIANDGAGTAAADSHPPMMNLLFKKGEIASGTYPILKTAGGTTIPYTYYNKTSWSDGSLKILPVLCRFPSSINAAATANVEVWSGGSAQSASGLTLSDLYAENFKVVAVGYATSNDNLSGTWTCDLQASSILETVVYGDGPAGIIWRILADFKQSGSAHGQLTTYFYVQGLKGPSGLAGWRILPRVTQPWYNDSVSPAKVWRGFSSLTLQYGSGPTTFDPAANAWTAKTFTWKGSADTFTSTAHGYNEGVSGRLTTTGTLPAGLSLNKTYWIKLDFNNPNEFRLVDHPMTNAGSGTSISDGGSGTHTFTPGNFVCQFGSAFIATSKGKYVYVQGAGSVASEPNLRIIADKTYDRATKIIPPYNLSIGTVTTNSYTGDWTPQNIGPLTGYIGAASERDDLGIISAFHARHFFTQSANDEKLMRLIGLAQGHLSALVKDVTTKNFVNLSKSSYTGMPANVYSSFKWNAAGGEASGFTAPTGGTTFAGAIFTGPSMDHQTDHNFYTYIATGEPQAFDMVQEFANYNMGSFSPSSKDLTVGATTYYMIASAAKAGGVRTNAWSGRTMAYGAIVSPDAHPDGSDTSSYFKAFITNEFTYLTAWQADQVASNAWWGTSGFYHPQGTASGRSSWQGGYYWSFLNTAAWALENTDAQALCAHHLKWPCYVAAQSGNLWCLGTYYELNSTSANTLGPPFSNGDGYWGPYCTASNISWTISGNQFTWSSPKHTPTNGDRVIFWCLQRPGSNFSFMTTYYAVNTSGNNFQLSATPGGSAIVVQTDSDLIAFGNGTGQPVYAQFAAIVIPASPPSTGFVSSSDYGANQRGNINWSVAGGATATGIAAVVSEMATRLGSYGYTSDPKWAMSSSF